LELELARLELEQELVLALANLVLVQVWATQALALVLEQVLANLELELVLRRNTLPHMEMNTSSCLVDCTRHRLLLAPIPLHTRNQKQTIVHI